ncbi:MAG: C25 family cysteine peptidase, partial [Bacteroidota bacterium]|nr:C25 family cysteine peptidase [Bacteroidota bacterium]
MRKIILLSILAFFVTTAFSQNRLINAESFSSKEKQIILDVSDNGCQEIKLAYSFKSTLNATKLVDGTSFSMLNLKGFSHTKEIGKPAVPAHNEIIAVPLGAKATIKIHKLSYRDTSGFLCYPAQAPSPDSYNAPQPKFTYNEEFYTHDVIYPEMPVEIIERLKWRGMEMLIVQVRPVLYNPYQKKYRMYSEIEFSVEFEGGSDFVDASQHSRDFLKIYSAAFRNRSSIEKEISKKQNTIQNIKGDARNYIIITTDEYYDAAEKLAGWKNQLGYSVEIVSQSNWTSSEVKSAIESRYQNWTPKPDYFVILGDHPDVPAQDMGSHVTDLYYACMDGGNDFWPDMARGRISVSTNSYAHSVINKIIKYESVPVSNPDFYSTGTHAAYFQESSTPGYAERRFAQTAEESLFYMQNQLGFDVNRVYVTGSSVSPTNWNYGNYSAGEAIPSYLLKPGFAWDGSASDINTHINNGSLYVLHRDHGFELGWGDPYYDLSNINNLSNGDLTPVVFSINCLTGKFNVSECFAEKFLRKNPGGAVGVFAHAEVSYSGYNDGLAMGLFDAIWANPGLIPNFTGSGGVNNPGATPHDPILTMGHVLNHSLIRMMETWGVNQYSNELFHYFGDPAMKMWTIEPIEITATYTNTIMCGVDSVIEISNASVPDAMVTLVIDNELIASTQLVNGAGTLEFSPVAGTDGIITISASNHRPKIASVYILGGCPKSKFIIGASHFCLSDSVWFESNATGDITSYNWDFGPGAMPQTDTTEGPHTVYYSIPGNKTITLEVSGLAGSDIYDRQITIDADCKFYVPTMGTQMVSFCYGVLYDDGGSGNYSDNTNGTFIIEPDGASGITLYFNSFNFEFDWDTLFIYDGYVSQGNLIGNYTGSTLPNGGVINATSGVVSIIQQTDQAVTESGFELEWTCSYPNSAPHSDFLLLDINSCMGEVDFYDISTNLPDTWEWNFGDGNFSNLQNPTHIYQTNGIFDVSLIALNSFGSDTAIYYSLVEIERPQVPEIEDSVDICGPGTVDLTAYSAGEIFWYDSPIAITPISSGPQFQVTIDSSQYFYVENVEPAPPAFGAKFNNAGGGGMFTYSSSHYLVFDVDEEFLLKTVKVYADGAGDRTVELRNASGTAIETATINIPDGESRIDLNWTIQPGVDYRLAAGASPYLYRNNSSCTYPYDIAGFGTVKHSSASSNPTKYYYFFYDWEVVGGKCYSPRIPYAAFVFNDPPEASFDYIMMNDSLVIFTNTSLNATACTWSFGDNNFSNAISPTHNYIQIGPYDVMMIASNACGEDTSIATVMVGIDDIDSPNNSIRVYPNPATGHVNIVFSKTSS